MFMDLKIFLTGLVAILSVVLGSAQDTTVVSDVNVSANGKAEEMINRLTGSSAGVSIEGSAVLFQRAVVMPEVEAETSFEELAEEGSEVQDVEKQRVRGKHVGYRVQVYADKTEARQRERAIGNSFPQYGTYVSYASPFWRLRVGDFRSQYEAEKAAAEIKRQFPGYAKEVRVVRDRVNVK